MSQMLWVERLPEVADGILRPLALMRSKLSQAASLDAQAMGLRESAYHDSLALEGRIRVMWTEQEIQAAKAATNND
jgi:hypothetical protein